MKCPFPVIEVVPDSFPPEMGWRDCLKEECAWYYDAANCCVILRLNTNLGLLASSLRDIASKTPLGGRLEQPLMG